VPGSRRFRSDPTPTGGGSPATPGVLDPLRVPAFRRLACTYALNELTWGVGTVALVVLVYAHTGSALATSGLWIASAAAPAVLAPLLTARVDRLPTRTSLPALYALEALVFAVLAALTDDPLLPLVLALALLDGTVALTGRGITRAAVSGALQPAGLLTAGNALLNVLFAVCLTAGPALGGLLLSQFGPRTGLIVAGAIFLAMALVLVTARTLPVAGAQETSGPRGVARAAEALRYVRATPRLRRLVGVHAGTLVCTMLLSPVEVVFARELTGRDAAYGVMLAVWGAGTVVGSLVFARLRGGAPGRATAWSTALIGVGMLVLAVAPGFGIALVGSFLGGAGNGVWSVSVIDRIQQRLPAEFQARVMGLLESVVAASSGLGFLLAGLLEGPLGARGVIALAGVGTVLAAFAYAWALTGSRDPDDPGPDATAPMLAASASG
jgi:predicted MFS family arabinose efflux permease